MEFVPGYRAQYAPRRKNEARRHEGTEARSEEAEAPAATPSDTAIPAIEDLSDLRPTPTAPPKSGNGHGPRIGPDTAKPFNYGTATDEALKDTHGGHLPSSAKGSPATGSTSNLRLAIVSDPLSQQGSELQADAPACDVCGSITVRSGTCYKCLNCGNSMGCS